MIVLNLNIAVELFLTVTSDREKFWLPMKSTALFSSMVTAQDGTQRQVSKTSFELLTWMFPDSTVPLIVPASAFAVS